MTSGKLKLKLWFLLYFLYIKFYLEVIHSYSLHEYHGQKTPRPSSFGLFTEKLLNGQFEMETQKRVKKYAILKEVLKIV